MRVFCVVGVTKSGKTTTIEHIVAELRQRGYSVGSVKEIHYGTFQMDKEGSNTHRHKLAGSQLVTARGDYETDVLYQRKLDMETLLAFYPYDFVVLEGVDDIVAPTIITGHTKTDVNIKMRPTAFLISGRISDEIEEYRGLKAMSALNNIKALVDEIEQKVGEYQPQISYKLLQNGKSIPLDNWRSLLLAQALQGLDLTGEFIIKQVEKQP